MSLLSRVNKFFMKASSDADVSIDTANGASTSGSNTKIYIIIGVAIILIALILYWWLSPKKSNKDLNKESLEQELPISVDDLSTNKPNAKNTLMYFWSPSCPYCIKFHPMWKELINLYADDPNINFQAVDVSDSKNKHLANYYNIGPVPTIILKTKFKTPEFEGHRSIENLHNFIERELVEDQSATSPSPRSITTPTRSQLESPITSPVSPVVSPRSPISPISHSHYFMPDYPPPPRTGDYSHIHPCAMCNSSAH
jgi:thiol-disulfide isomerase/thioredoxin